MNLFTWVCVTQAIWQNALAVYHTPSFEVFKPPKSLGNDSYFGYSITYDQLYKRLVISAPRENNIGEVYHCEIDKQNCVPIANEIQRVSTVYTHDYWFGATVKAGPDFVVMCSPRYTDKCCNEKRFGTYGKCYSHHNGSLELMKSISDDDRKETISMTLEQTMDSFGWSIHVASDNSIIVGGPGMFTGRAMLYAQRTSYPRRLRLKSEVTFNFGYAVSSGKFMNNELSYAVSSTYGAKGLGIVLFFSGIQHTVTLAKPAAAEVVGSMFGAVLCAAKLSGTKNDLLVGAPTYARGYSYNLGAVYLFVARKRNGPLAYRRTIIGQNRGSHFGSAIISLGDLNGDARDEIAIGAPFENDGRGAVYLYSGADLISGMNEDTLTALQKIEPSDSVAKHFVNTHSFGMSLTTLLDYDDNGCNELAIGAPFSDAVVLLRCMAAVTVQIHATFPSLQNRTLSKRTNFEFKVCLNVEYPPKPKNIIANITTTVEMTHSHARVIGVDGTGTFKFDTLLTDKQPQYCKNVPFILPSDGNYEMAIGYLITSTLNDNPRNILEFNENRVILSDRSILTRRDAVWAAECSGHKECVPKLKLDTDFSFRYVDSTYIVGSSEKEHFNIILANSGEVAYDACVRVHIVGAPLAETPASCVPEPSSDGGRLKCAPTKPLRSDEPWVSGSIVLHMTQLTNLNKNISVELLVYNHCKGDVTENRTVVTKLRGEPNGIVVKGETDIGDSVNLTKTEVYYDGKQMQHVYTITNRGLTNWAELSVEVVLELKPYIKYNEQGTVYYANKSIPYRECERRSTDAERSIYECKIESLKAKGEPAKIVVPINIVPGVLDNLWDENEIFSSNFTLLFDGFKSIRQSIFTTIGPAPSVPVWVILLAALVGLFILIILAFALYECGFLRRKNREELKNLRQSVRRQTMMRRSTMPKPPAEDRQQILETTAEEQEDIALPPPDKATTSQ